MSELKEKEGEPVQLNIRTGDVQSDNKKQHTSARATQSFMSMLNKMFKYLNLDPNEQ